jgi:hypothetical protein
MVKARAIVNVIFEPPANSKGLGRYRVECWGAPPHDYVKIYVINAVSEDKAAREGLDKFVQDVQPSVQEA